MKNKNVIFTITLLMLVFFITGCETENERNTREVYEEEREYASISLYEELLDKEVDIQDKEALRNFYHYIDDEYSNEYVLWELKVDTVHFDEDKPSSILRTSLLSDSDQEIYVSIEGRFDYVEDRLKEGDTVIISGKVYDYYKNSINSDIFDIWLSDCRVEEVDSKVIEKMENDVKLYDKWLKKKNEEKWFEDNILGTIQKELPLPENITYFYDNVGLSVYKSDDEKTKLESPYELHLSFAESGFLKPKIITDQDIMKKVSHDVSKLIYDNLDKMNFNLGVVGIHFSRVDQQDITQHPNNFFIGINTIVEYFENEKNSDDYMTYYQWLVYFDNRTKTVPVT